METFSWVKKLAPDLINIENSIPGWPGQYILAKQMQIPTNCAEYQRTGDIRAPQREGRRYVKIDEEMVDILRNRIMEKPIANLQELNQQVWLQLLRKPHETY